MSESDPAEVEGTDSTDARSRRARWEHFAFSVAVPADGSEPGRVNVANHSHQQPHVYTVTVDGQGEPTGCTCPDWEHRQPDGGCKHMRAVSAQSPVVLAASGTAEGEGGERAVRTDGGSQATEGECQCAEWDYPCAECYISGVRDWPDDV